MAKRNTTKEKQLLQNIPQKTKDQETQTPPKTRDSAISNHYNYKRKMCLSRLYLLIVAYLVSLVEQDISI